jgi:hypothetical protein
MSFDSRDLAIDVLPVAFARPGLQMCAQATAGGLDEDEEEEDDLECAQATAGDTGYVATDGLDLLRQQLRQRLASEEGA